MTLTKFVKNKDLTPCFLCFVFVLILSTTAQAVPSVLLRSFTVRKPQNNYLRIGLRDMLASRLAALGMTVSTTGSSKNKSVLIQGHYNAGKGCIEVEIKRPAQQKIKFTVTVRRTTDLLAALDRLSIDIGRLFGLRPVVKSQPPAASPRPRKSFSRRPTFPWRQSQPFNIALKVLNVGDVNGDGHKDLILAGDDNLLILKINGDKFTPLARFNGPPDSHIVGISLGDLNHDGLDEIYIGAKNQDGPSSYILGWQGRKLYYIDRDIDCYLRVIRKGKRKKLLIGQYGEGAAGGFQNGIYLMNRKAGRLVPKQQLTLPLPVNIFNFAIADLNIDQEEDIITMTKGELWIIRPDGRYLWRSTAGLPESLKSLMINSQRGSHERRIIVHDINGNGFPEIITAGAFFIGNNKFNLGENKINILAWTNNRPKILWHTKVLADQIVDYQLLNRQTEQDAVIIGVRIKHGLSRLLAPEQCRILLYPIPKAIQQTKRKKL
ncbi:FG-GAP repeat domain-containing protein [Desulfobacterota bacterium M19]